MAWRRPDDKPLSEPMMFSLLTHQCVTRPQWVNSLRPDDAYMHQWTRSSLFHIMACHLVGTKPLNWTNAALQLIRSLWTIFTEIWIKNNDFIQENTCNNVCHFVCRLQCVNKYFWHLVTQTSAYIGHDFSVTSQLTYNYHGPIPLQFKAQLAVISNAMVLNLTH